MYIPGIERSCRLGKRPIVIRVFRFANLVFRNKQIIVGSEIGHRVAFDYLVSVPIVNKRVVIIHFVMGKRINLYRIHGVGSRGVFIGKESALGSRGGNELNGLPSLRKRNASYIDIFAVGYFFHARRVNVYA